MMVSPELTDQRLAVGEALICTDSLSKTVLEPGVREAVAGIP